MALLVDWTLVSGLTALLLLSFLQPDQNGLRLAGVPLTFTTCRVLNSVTPELHDLVGPEVIAVATLCEARPFGIYNGRTINLVYALKPIRNGYVTTSTVRRLAVSIDAQDRVTRTFAPLPLLLMIASAMFVGRTGWTPGKRLVELRVRGGGCAICRELRRLAVFVLLGAAGLAISLPPVPLVAILAATPVWMFTGFGVVLFAVFLAFHVWTMIRWRGAMPYDRATGFEVVRTA